METQTFWKRSDAELRATDQDTTAAGGETYARDIVLIQQVDQTRQRMTA
jgi:hypothetical protein